MNNFTLNASIVCVPQDTNYLFAELIATLISLPINIFLIACVIAYRHKLSTQVVNIYATNVLIAITVSTITRCFDCVWCYYGFGSPSYPSPGPMGYHSLTMKLWAFQKTLVVCTYTIISMTIALVILSLRSKVFRVHRTVAGVSESDENSELPAVNPEAKRSSCVCWTNKTYRLRLSIALSWCIPLTFTVFEVIFEPCTQKCVCLYQYVVLGDRTRTCGNGCSVIWPPVSNYFLSFGCVVWVISAIMLVALLVRSEFDFTRVRNKMAASRLPSQRPRPSKQLSPFEIDQQRYDITEPYINEEPRRSDTATARHHQSFLVLDSLAQQLQWMKVVCALYIVGTGCMVGLAIYTLATKDYSSLAGKGDQVIFIFLIPTLSETIASIVICTKLPRLRQAVRSMVLKIFSC